MVNISERNLTNDITSVNLRPGTERLVETIRPDFKPGIRIQNETYLALAFYMLNLISNDDELTLAVVIGKTRQQFNFLDVEVIAYNVKLDLEARGYISFRPSLSVKHERWLCITSKGRKFLNSKDSEIDSRSSRG